MILKGKRNTSFFFSSILHDPPRIPWIWMLKQRSEFPAQAAKQTESQLSSSQLLCDPVLCELPRLCKSHPSAAPTKLKQTLKDICGFMTRLRVRPSPLVPVCLEKAVHHIFSLPSRLTWVGICARRMFCSVSIEMPGAVVAKCGLRLSVAGLGTPGWLAPVFTSDPFPKAWIAFSGTKEQPQRHRHDIHA